MVESSQSREAVFTAVLCGPGRWLPANNIRYHNDAVPDNDLRLRSDDPETSG